MREGVALRRPSPFSRRFGDFLPSPTKKSHRRLRLFPKHRTSPCRPSPEARPSPFRRTFFWSRVALLFPPPRSRTATPPLLNVSGSLLFSATSDSAEILHFPPAELRHFPCEALRSPSADLLCNLRSESAVPRPRRKTLQLTARSTARDARSAPLNAAARPSTPSPIRRPIRREAADPRRPRPAAKFPDISAKSPRTPR